METLNRFLFLKTFQGLRHAHGLIFKGQSLAPGVSCYALARCFTSHFSQDMKVVFHKAAKADLTRNYRFLCTVTANRVCWNCGSSTELFFCSSCKVIQPPRDDINYFQILNCEEKFSLDTKKLQKRFVELQRYLHPDNFSQKSLKEQENSETQSALVNKAYRTLQKPLSRAIYMLELRGILLEEGTDATADPAILLEVMEVNESLAETRNQDEVYAIGQSVRDKLKDLTEQMNLSLNKGDLLTAKGLLVQMKYLSNIEEKVKKRITESW